MSRTRLELWLVVAGILLTAAKPSQKKIQLAAPYIDKTQPGGIKHDPYLGFKPETDPTKRARIPKKNESPNPNDRAYDGLSEGLSSVVNKWVIDKPLSPSPVQGPTEESKSFTYTRPLGSKK